MFSGTMKYVDRIQPSASNNTFHTIASPPSSLLQEPLFLLQSAVEPCDIGDAIILLFTLWPQLETPTPQRAAPLDLGHAASLPRSAHATPSASIHRGHRRLTDVFPRLHSTLLCSPTIARIAIERL